MVGLIQNCKLIKTSFRIFLYKPFLFLKVLECAAVTRISHISTNQMSEGFDWWKLFKGPNIPSAEFPEWLQSCCWKGGNSWVWNITAKKMKWKISHKNSHRSQGWHSWFSYSDSFSVQRFTWFLDSLGWIYKFTFVW